MALRDAGQPHRLDQFVDPPGRHAADPRLLDHADQRFLGGLARLQERREVRTLAQLGNAPLKRAEPGVETTLAVAVAVIKPVAGAFVPAGANQACDIGFHQDLQHRLRYGAQEIAVTALLQQLDQRHSIVGHRVLGGCWWVSQLHRNAHLPGDHPSLTRAPLDVLGHCARRALTTEFPPPSRTLTSPDRAQSIHAALRDAAQIIDRMPSTFMTYPTGGRILPVERSRLRGSPSIRCQGVELVANTIGAELPTTRPKLYGGRCPEVGS